VKYGPRLYAAAMAEVAAPLLIAAGGAGVASFRLAPSGRLSPASPSALELPSAVAWVASHPSGRTVYATLNPPVPAPPQGNAPAAAVPVTDVVALELHPDTGVLRVLGQPQQCGRVPCFCTVDATGRWLLSCNFLDGQVVVHAIRPDGSLGPAAHRQSQLIALGLPDDDDATRAAGNSRSAAHHVVLSAANDYAHVSDLRLDCIVSYRFDAKTGRLEPAGRTENPTHTGCRHLVLGKDGRYAYGVNQGRLSQPAGSLSVYRMHAQQQQGGRAAELLDRLPTLPAGVAVVRAHESKRRALG